ncbi:MAG: nitroreductase family protein [Mangrovicoccus sp.]
MRDGELETIRSYHALSSHSEDGYAPGPDRVEWSTQPSPFRRYYDGPALIPLPSEPEQSSATYADLFSPGAIGAAEMTLASIGQLLQLSLGISGWKTMAGEKWAVRCNPSSGNLHPVEAYILLGGVPGLGDGLYHYDVLNHALELRCAAQLDQPGLWLGLTSIASRESWKYGSRAFRYCQLDLGHAEAAIGFAAASLGWTAQRVTCGHDELASLLGTDRGDDFSGVEPEEPELLLQLQGDLPGAPQFPRHVALAWCGRPSRCAKADQETWPELSEIIEATRGQVPPIPSGPNLPVYERTEFQAPAAQVIRQRRSARQFTSKTPPGPEMLQKMLSAALPQAGPLDQLAGGLGLEMLLAVHKIAGMEPGLYAIEQSDGATALRPHLRKELGWSPVSSLTGMENLRCLAPGDIRAQIRKLSCSQAIAAEGAATLVFLGDFDRIWAEGAALYKELHREAGKIAHALYLEASALGLGATGLGCFLDRDIRELALLPGSSLYPLYLFGFGQAKPDPYLQPAQPA